MIRSCHTCVTDIEYFTNLHCGKCGKHIAVGLTVQAYVSFGSLKVPTTVVVCDQKCAEALKSQQP